MIREIKTWCVFHEWSKWKDIGGGDLIDSVGDRIGKYVRQEKRCVKCNILKLRDVNVR